MPAKQALLFPDPRPLVDRLGTDFFRGLPECPGVYLMRDPRAAVLYVGKAKNLRKRLNSYRVANPERFRRRHLRLLRAVARVEWEECADEASALLREADLIRELRPPFNRAGTWPAPPRFIAWRVTERGLELGLVEQAGPDWNSEGPLSGGALHVYAALARIFWLGLNPGRGFAELPAGWSAGALPLQVTIAGRDSQAVEAAQFLGPLFNGEFESLSSWVGGRASAQPFGQAMLAEDLEALRRRFRKREVAASLAH